MFNCCNTTRTSLYLYVLACLLTLASRPCVCGSHYICLGVIQPRGRKTPCCTNIFCLSRSAQLSRNDAESHAFGAKKDQQSYACRCTVLVATRSLVHRQCAKQIIVASLWFRDRPCVFIVGSESVLQRPPPAPTPVCV